MRYAQSRRFPRLLSFLAMAAILSARLWSQAEAVLPAGAYLLPPRFNAGDVVELRLPLKGGQPRGKRELRVPEYGEDYEIRSVLMESGSQGATLSIFFIPWKSGNIAIPPFREDGVEFPGASINVQSILGGDGEKVRPPRGFLFLPGTRTMVVIALSSLAALVLSAWAIAAFLLPFASRLASARRERRPYKRFQHELRILRKRMEDTDRSYFYALLSRAFRAYAEARLLPGFASMTAGEIGRGGQALTGILGKDGDEAAAVLMRSDLVRFAERPSSRGEREGDAALLSKVVDAMEAERAGA